MYENSSPQSQHPPTSILCGMGHQCLRACMEKYLNLYLYTRNVDEDHVHFQIEITPSVSVATAIQHIEALTSIHLKRKFKFIRDMYMGGGIWSVEYFSSTIGLIKWQPLEFS